LVAIRGQGKYFVNPNSGKERSRAGAAGPAMRENRQVFPHKVGEADR
jgi:hypothetical protein